MLSGKLSVLSALSGGNSTEISHSQSGVEHPTSDEMPREVSAFK